MTSSLFAAAVFGLAAACCRAVSNGDTAACDPHGDFGCSTWNAGNRKECAEASPGIMPWVSRPERTASYVVREAWGAAAYMPSTLVTIEVKVTAYEWKYRGFLMDAVSNVTGTLQTVGRFVFPESRAGFFWEPPSCKGAAVHTHADVKPFVVRLKWEAPPPGSGPITFRTLLKRGPANVGAFHYPQTDMRLEEAGAGAAGEGVVEGRSEVSLGDDGLSCDAHCATLSGGQVCDGAALAEAASADGFARVVGPYYACPSEPVVSCSLAAPGVDADGACHALVDDFSAACPKIASDATKQCADAGKTACTFYSHDNIPPPAFGMPRCVWSGVGRRER